MIDPITSFATTVKLAEGGWKFISKFRPTYCMEAGETFLLEADKLTNEHFDKIPNDVLTEIHSKISQARMIKNRFIESKDSRSKLKLYHQVQLSRQFRCSSAKVYTTVKAQTSPCIEADQQRRLLARPDAAEGNISGLTVENALAFSMIPMDTRKEYDVHIYLLDMPEHGVDLRVNDDSFDVPQSNTIWYMCLMPCKHCLPSFLMAAQEVDGGVAALDLLPPSRPNLVASALMTMESHIRIYLPDVQSRWIDLYIKNNRMYVPDRSVRWEIFVKQRACFVTTRDAVLDNLAEDVASQVGTRISSTSILPETAFLKPDTKSILEPPPIEYLSHSAPHESPRPSEDISSDQKRPGDSEDVADDESMADFYSIWSNSDTLWQG